VATFKKECGNIERKIKAVASEVLGRKRKYIKGKGLRIWKKEMEQAITGKRSAYLVHLQINTEKSKETYKIRRNIA
jgi:hypothetical protein